MLLLLLPGYPLMTGRLPGAASSIWSSSPASSRSPRTPESPVEQLVYPLSRPTSPGSAVDDRERYGTLSPIALHEQAHQSSATFATAASPPRPSPSRVSPQIAPAEPPSPHFDTPEANLPIQSPPDRMPSRFPFLRRSSSATDVNDFPAAPSSTSSFFSPGSHAVPLLKSRKLLANPSASASTNDLPSLVAQPGPPSASPRPTRAPTFELGAAGALGPKAGARLLASREAQRAIQLAADAQTDDFDMHERLERDGLTGGRAEPRDANVQTQQGRRVEHSSSGSRSGSGSSGAIRRVPVPALDDVALVDLSAQQGSNRETSLQQLTRRASEEDREGRDAEAARRRNASLSKACGAGLGSPFASPGAHAPPNKPARRPPIAGLNRAGDADEQGRRVLSAGGPSARRQRTASGGSTSSLSKDIVLAQLGEAVRRERKKAEMYERECEQGQKEVRIFTARPSLLQVLTFRGPFHS